ncbi:MAG: SMC family ATPase, partial [Candidatus Phosphoribacter sp.]
MRVHRLTVAAFGPFAEPIEVAFDDLAAAGIFLIHGSTGSGKTSLLDAVCFALFARVPGGRPSGVSLTSQHARAARPEVQLEFTAAGHRLRVTRSPEHLRPKRRGTGLTAVKATVCLEEHIGGRWMVLSTRADEAADVLHERLGMGLEQFAKVVMLPQGDFAAFLRATPEDRRLLLERLFDVSRFSDVETWLAGRRRDSASAAEHARATVHMELGRLGDVLGRLPHGVFEGLPHGVFEGLPDAVFEGLPDAVPGGGLANMLDAARARTRDHALVMLAARDQAVLVADAAEQAARAGAQTSQMRARGLAAQAELDALTATADERNVDQTRAEAAQRASRVAGDLRALAAAAEASALARAAQEQAQIRLDELGIGDESTGSDELAARMADADPTVDEVARLGRLLARRARQRAELLGDGESARQALSWT